MNEQAEIDAFFAAEDRRELVEAVNDEARLFAATGNGLAVWRAYRICREAGEPVPEEILSFLDHVGRALEQANSSNEIAAALRMETRGRISARRHLAQADEAFAIASAVHLLCSLPRPVGMLEACRRVAERRGIAAATVKQAYLRWRRRQRPSHHVKQKRPANSVFEWGQ